MFNNLFSVSLANNNFIAPDSGDVKKPVFTQIGIASFYAKKFHNKKTASGERFNMYDHTAAHLFLGFGTYVKVTNLGNNKSLIVRINDRGPYVKGRIIDLSYAAAKEIDFIQRGIALVKIETIAETDPSKKNEIIVFNHEALYNDDSTKIKNITKPNSKLKENSLNLAKDETKTLSKDITPQNNNESIDKKISYSVQVGAFVNPNNAERLKKSLIGKKFKDINIFQITEYKIIMYKVQVGNFLNYEEANDHKEKLLKNSIDGFIIRND